jgi:FkbM family methyltransferase
LGRDNNKYMLNSIYFSIKNLTYLSRSSLPHKAKIFVKYLFMSVKLETRNWFGDGKIPEESFLGVKIKSFSYSTIHFLFGEIFFRGEYDFKPENDHPVILDCGANIGMATLFFKWRYPKSTIYSFEPDPETFRLLVENVKRNGLINVCPQNLALSDKNGVADFYISRKNTGSLKMSLLKERVGGEKIEAKVVLLSDFIKSKRISRIDFIKMDIEGAENAVLEEMGTSGLLKSVDKMIIEYHHNISGHDSDMKNILSILDSSDFRYQIDAHNIPVNSEGAFQDVLIYCYR